MPCFSSNYLEPNRFETAEKEEKESEVLGEGYGSVEHLKRGQASCLGEAMTREITQKRVLCNYGKERRKRKRIFCLRCGVCVSAA